MISTGRSQIPSAVGYKINTSRLRDYVFIVEENEFSSERA